MPEHDILIATVAGQPMYGTQAEYDAVRIPTGTAVRVTRANGDIIHGTLVGSWIFDDIVFDVRMATGNVVHCFITLGDTIERCDEKTRKPTCTGDEGEVE